MAKLTTAEFIEAIKELSVLELNDLVKACEEEFGVSAAAGVVVAAAGPAAAAEEKTDFDVELTEVGSEKIKVIKTGIYPLYSRFSLLHQSVGKVNRVSVMRTEHEEAYYLAVIFLTYIAYCEEITERFTHFLVIYINISVMHPVICKRLSVCALALCYFIFVVREN